LQPVYTEYNVGNYARSFQLSSKIEQDAISAELKDGDDVGSAEGGESDTAKDHGDLSGPGRDTAAADAGPASAIGDFGGFEPHERYTVGLKSEHGRKTFFWTLIS
jgi:hypothetical protein